MVKEKQKSVWQPVQLNEAFISKGIEGLVGIEELKNYDLNIVRKGNIRNKIKVKKTTTLKRKATESEFGLNAKQKTRKLLEKTERTGKKKTSAFGKTIHNLKNIKSKPAVCVKEKLVEKSVRIDQTKKIILGETICEFKNIKSKHVKDKTKEVHVTNDESITGMEAWNGLYVPLPVLNALAEMGFKEPTEIQALALPSAILGRRDILGAAETGSGKTLAFGIPIIHGILEEKEKEENLTSYVESDDDNFSLEEIDDTNSEDIGCVKVTKLAFVPRTKLYALILTPTRELAIQVRNHLIAAAKYTSLKVAVIVGGMAAQKQERLLKRGPEIVVATPGRLWELIEEGNPHLTQVNDIRFLAIDETDRMVERGHFHELQTLLERINTDDVKRKCRQNFVFSATLTLVHELPKHTKKSKHKALRVTPGQKLQSIINMLGITNPKVVDVTQSTGIAGKLSEARILCPLEDKDLYLYYILQRHPGRTLVFCNSISCVRRLAQVLQLLQCSPLPLHANMIQRQRLKNLERFRDNANSLLLATDVAARGLDIPNVEHVIHYQVPRTSEGYVHRSGRTARAQREGITILLIEPSEIPYYTRLCRTLGRDKDLPLFPVKDELFLAIKERVHLARELDKLELATRRNKAQTGWFQKAMKDMDVVLDKDELPVKFSDSTTSNIKREVSAKRKHLNALLSRSLIPKSISVAHSFKMAKLDKNIPKILKEEHEPGMFVRKKND